MRVLVATNMLPIPQRPWFGTFVGDQIEDLRGLGVDVSVLFVNGAARRSDYLRGAAELRRRVREDAVDIVHAHYGLTGAIAVLQRTAPVVTTFHGSDCSGEIQWQRLVSWVVARACTPIFVSDQLAASIGCEGAVVIPAAVDLETFAPVERNIARKELGWPEESVVALLPGSRLNKIKNAALFDLALEHARAVLPELRGVSLEGLTRKQVALTMNGADVTVMTSRAEGSPVTVRESLACRIPVVSVPVGDVRVLLDGLPGCSVVPRDQARIAAAIIDAVACGRPAELRERVEQYSRPKTAERVLGVYREVVDRTLA